jgi:CheY-like chemotaxis protein
MRIAVVGDGRAAIERIAADPPDIILAEVSLAEHDGYHVAAFVAESVHLASIPVVLLAGVSDPIDGARARRLGCRGVLLKPLNPQDVVTRVHALLADRLSPSGNSGAYPAVSTTTPDATRPSPAPPVADAGDYLDRLDAAFAALSAPRDRFPETGARPHVSGDAAGDHPTASPESARTDDVVPGRGDDGSARGAESSQGFSALSRGAQAQRAQLGPVPEPRTLRGAGEPAMPAIPDAVIDEIARRVVLRLGDDDMRRAVLDAAERLVREEIDRIKAAAGQTPPPA